MDQKVFLLFYCASQLLCTAATHIPCVTHNLTLSLENAVHVSDVVMTGRAIGRLAEGERGTLKGRVSYYFAYKNDTLLPRLWLGSTEVKNFRSEDKAGHIALFFLFREPDGSLALHCMSPFSMLLPLLRSESHLAVHQASGQSSISSLLRHVERIGRADNKINIEFVSPSPSPCEELSPCASQGSFCSLRNTLHSEDFRCTCLTGFIGDGRNCTSLVNEVTEAPPTEAPPLSYSCSDCLYGAECLDTSFLTQCTCSHIRCNEAPPIPNETTPTSRDLRVCGSDYQTYSSQCHLRRRSCDVQKPLYTLHNGPCLPDVMPPCGGGVASPLTDEGGLVRCGLEGECPAVAFCHDTSSYNVCCPVMTPVQPTPTVSVTPSDSTSSSILVPTSRIPVPTSLPESASGSGFDSFSGSGHDAVATETINLSLLDDEDYARRL